MSKTKHLTLCAILIALALALSYTERFIPLQMLIPLPGVKLGLANIVTLIALYLMGAKSAFAVLIPRCIFGAVFGGGITGLLFSLAGGILAMLTMILAKKIVTTKRSEPNVAATIFALTNLKGEVWKNKQNTDITTNGKDINQQISPAEAAALLKKLEEEV